MQTKPESPLHAGLLVFPGMTQLDMTGPYEVLCRVPGLEVHLVAETLDLQVSEHGLPIQPTQTFDSCPTLQVLVVPGGFGVNDLLLHLSTLAFLRRAAEEARYVGSVCTGALLLGAAGLLAGKKATTHWMSLELLKDFGAVPVADRVVVDGTLLTGGGITAGIDFALVLVDELFGRAVAEEIQLAMEYDPAPPLDAGSPQKADPAVVDALKSKWSKSMEKRRDRVRRAADRLRRD